MGVSGSGGWKSGLTAFTMRENVPDAANHEEGSRSEQSASSPRLVCHARMRTGNA